MDVACGRWPHKKSGLRCGRTRRPAGYGWHGVYFCSVGRAFTPAVPGCLTRPLFGCVGVRSMRRGGIDAAREKRYGRWAFTVCRVCILPCRAGVHARRTNQYFKFFNVRRAKSPALQSGVTGRASRKPRAGRTSAAGLDPAAQGKAKALPMGSKRLF